MRNGIVWAVVCLMVAIGLVVFISCSGGGSSDPASSTTTDVSGNWDIVLVYNGSSKSLPTYGINQSGSNLALSYACDLTSKGTGTINGTSVTFNSNSSCLNFTFSGTYNNNAISGTWTADNGYSGTFTMTKNTQGSCSQMTIPTATITIDGNISDWSGINPIITDQTGDGNASVSGSDLYKIYLAKDSTNLYVRLDMANGIPSDNLYVGVDIYQKIDQQAGDRMIFFNFPNSVSVDSRDSTCQGYHTTLATGTMIVNGSTVEAYVPLSALNPSATSYIMVHDDAEDIGLESIDDTSVVKGLF